MSSTYLKMLVQVLGERAPSDEEEAQVQPHTRWIEANRDVLRAHANSFVALDPDEGIVVRAPRGRQFALYPGPNDGTAGGGHP
jgi:hypothetical protein